MRLVRVIGNMIGLPAEKIRAFRTTRRQVAASVAVVGLVLALLFSARGSARADDSRSDLATPAVAAATFDRFIETHGGIEAIGAALGAVEPDESRTNSFYREHRNFKLEYWPDLVGTPYAVQPALLGAEATHRRWFPTIRPFQSEESVVFFPETGHSVRFGFLDFFRGTGGIELLGYPISEELQEDGITLQYFQRGGLKYNPADANPVQPLALGEDAARRAASPWQAKIRNGPIPVVAPPGSTVRFLIDIENAGDAIWPQVGKNEVALSYDWKADQKLDPQEVVARFPLPAVVRPGDTVAMEVDITLPSTSGPYSLMWDLIVGDERISAIGTVEGRADVRVGLPMPDVRVGILELGPANDEDKQATVSATEDFTIDTLGGLRIAELPAGVRVATTYADGVYKLDIFGREPMLVAEPFTFTTASSGLMIVDEIQPGSLYRGSFEFRHSPQLESSWLINILPIDDYLAGLIEQGEEAPSESLKASVIAFRSYALAVQERIRKKNLEPFDLASSTTRTPSYFTRHQFYVGVRRDFDGDRLRETIENTRGLVVTYDSKVIEAVYFSQASGRTYGWAETWGRPGRPWALSVDDPISSGFRQVGHGVGMPLRSANALAVSGYSAEQILLTYYSNVNLNYAY